MLLTFFHDVKNIYKMDPELILVRVSTTAGMVTPTQSDIAKSINIFCA